MSERYERVDLGNVRGKTGDKGLDGIGIEEIQDLGYIDDENPFDHYYEIIWTDDTKEPQYFKIKDGENLSLATSVALGSNKAVTGGAIYNKFLTKADITHAHGDVLGDGSITNEIPSFDKNDKLLISDTSNNNRIQRGKSSTDNIVDDHAYTGIGSTSNSTQTTINNKINSAIGGLKTKQQDERNYGHEFIESTHTSSTNAWKGTSTTITSLKAGTVIYYKLKQNPSSSNTTLNLTIPTTSGGTTTTGAKNVMLRDGTNVTDQFPINSIIALVYDGTSWKTINSPQTDLETVNVTESSVFSTIGNQSGDSQHTINSLIDAKLDTLNFAAQNNTIPIDSAITSSSNNPVRSSTLYTAFNNKANSTHSHGNLKSTGIVEVGGTAQTYRNVCTDSNGYITTESKNNHTHTKSQITDFPTLSAVATSGNYNDLTNKVTVDTTLSGSSNNAIANSTVNTALGNKYTKNNTVTISSSTPVDLNNYSNPEFFVFAPIGQLAYVSNAPPNLEDSVFYLLVEKRDGNYSKQTLTSKLGNTWIRTKISNTGWNRWEQVTFNGDIKGSANILGVGGYSVTNGNMPTDGGLHNGHRCVRIDNSNLTGADTPATGNYSHIHWTLPQGFHQYNDVFTLSFWAKGTNGKQISTYFGGESGYVTVKRIASNSTVSDSVNASSSFDDGKTNFLLSSDWQHYYVTYKLNSTGDLTKKKQPIIRVWAGTDCYISSPKLERGHNATDWTPSVLNAELVYPNTDLNDFTMKGTYRSPLTAWAKLTINTPWQKTLDNKGYAFSLYVEPITDNGCVQKLTCFIPNQVYEWKRVFYNNMWGPWELTDNSYYCATICGSASGNDSYGYAKLFKIRLNSTYYNTPITFKIIQRNTLRPVECYLRFSNQNTTNPTIERFTYDGEDTDIYLCNEEEQYYTLYVRKKETNDYIEMKDWQCNDIYTNFSQKIVFYPLNEQIPLANLPYQNSNNYNNGNNDCKAYRHFVNKSYTSTVDWNTIKMDGVYDMPWRSSNDDTNRPTTSGGQLIVQENYNGYDQFFLVYGVNPDIWVRHYYKTNDTWYPWKKLLNWNQSEEYIESTHTSATSTWLGTSNTLLGIEKGTRIYYKLNQNPSTSNVTLNLTLGNGSTTGAKNVFTTGNVSVSNQYANGDVIPLIYDGSAWRVIQPTSRFADKKQVIDANNIEFVDKSDDSSGSIILNYLAR